MINPTIRTLLIWLGILLTMVTNLFVDSLALLMFLTLLSFANILTGCYIWTKLKNRHWVFMLWGILSPFGLLGISLLKDKSDGVIAR